MKWVRARKMQNEESLLRKKHSILFGGCLFVV